MLWCGVDLISDVKRNLSSDFDIFIHVTFELFHYKKIEAV